MKKLVSMLLASAMLLSLAACGGDKGTNGPSGPKEPEKPQVPFVVGTDSTEYTVDGASGWNTETVNVKISAGEDVLYNGTVTLTSDDLFVSEFTYAAIVEAGISQDGVLSGFITSIGDYVSGTDADGNYVYWGYTVNGKYVPMACNEMRMLEGDYVEWTFAAYSEDAGEPIPSGITAPFEVGTDSTEYTVDGASGWNTETLYIKISAGDDVLYNGTVTLTSDSLLVSEVTYAAIVEAGISQDGVLSGFVTSIGDYVSGTDADGNYMFWGYSVNGKSAPFGCNQLPVLDGDYIEWTFQTYEG